MLLSLCLLFLCFSALSASPYQDLKEILALKNTGSRIVNGKEAVDGQFPWQVAVMGRSNLYPSYLCGGAIISEEWILTAGHCVDGATAATIYSGVVSLTSRNRTLTQASDFILHEDFDDTYLNNDIGLIKLQTPLVFDDNTQAIAVAEEELEEDTLVTVSGWGQLDDDDTQPIASVLNYIEVLTIDNAACTRRYGSTIVSPSLVCTSADTNPVKSPCLGDSGAPVVANVDTKPVHVAVFSFVSANGCESSDPAGNTRTSYYRDWIREKTGI